jgi:hypothetical protein
VDDRGDSVTFSLSASGVEAYGADGSDQSGGSVSATVECRSIERHAAASWVTTDAIETEVTDTFTIDARDPDDVTYGIHEVEFAGAASAAGSTAERFVTVWQKQNSGCTWTEESGTELTGPWTASGAAVGAIRFAEDGSYDLDIYADTSGPDGVRQPDPQVPHRAWNAISNLSADCEGEGWDFTDTQSPRHPWASMLLGSADTDCVYAYIRGRLDPGDASSVVAGSMAWDIGPCISGLVDDERPPIVTRLTAEWHLEHDGPIDLPHS